MAGWFLFLLTFPIRNGKKGEAARRNEAGGEKKPLLFTCPKFRPNKLFCILISLSMDSVCNVL